MRVNPGANPNIQGTQAESLKRNERSEKTDRARRAEYSARTSSGISPGNAEISDRAKEFAKAHAVASAAPDVRDERIAEIKKRIAAGEYHIDSDKIAERMIGEHSL